MVVVEEHTLGSDVAPHGVALLVELENRARLVSGVETYQDVAVVERPRVEIGAARRRSQAAHDLAIDVDDLNHAVEPRENHDAGIDLGPLELRETGPIADWWREVTFGNGRRQQKTDGQQSSGSAVAHMEKSSLDRVVGALKTPHAV